MNEILGTLVVYYTIFAGAWALLEVVVPRRRPRPTKITLTCHGAQFSQADVGKICQINGMGGYEITGVTR